MSLRMQQVLGAAVDVRRDRLLPGLRRVPSAALR